jgi:histidine kinase/DNA gyrase B/HSP90-like ATPase
MRPAPTDINLADIAYQFGRARAQRAKRLIRRKESSLLRILSATDTSPNRDNLRARADVDALIDYYCIVTLAAMGGVLESPLPFSFRSEAIAELRQPDIWRYVVNRGADLLPRVLAHEIEINNGFFRVFCEDHSQFACFLDVIAIWSESNRRIAHFLRLFDSPSSSEGDAELLRLFADMKLGKAPTNASVKKRYAVLGGFSELLAFSYAYDELLWRVKEFPVFQSAIWHYIAPRFRSSSHRIMEFAQALAQSVPGCSSYPAFEAMLRIVGTRGSYYRPLYEFIHAPTFFGPKRIHERPDQLPSRWEFSSDSTKEWLDLNEVIQKMVAFAQGELERNGVELRTELAVDLPPVLGDRLQLQQVLLNLIMNGIEAMSTVGDRPRGLIIRTQSDEAHQVRIAVQDSGVGLDPQSLQGIFAPFFTTKRKGTGLGLSICRAILENHGGWLRAVPNDGPGTTVQVGLPAATKT